MDRKLGERRGLPERHFLRLGPRGLRSSDPRFSPHRFYRTRPRAREAKIPAVQREAKIPKAMRMVFRKAG